MIWRSVQIQSNKEHGNMSVIMLVSGESLQESVIAFGEAEVWSAPEFMFFATELILSIQVPMNMGKWIVRFC